LEKISGLYLPHSSILDILVFFGLIGLFFSAAFIIYTIVSKSRNPAYKYLLIFLAINILKSDSLLYINSLMLFALTFYLVRTKELITYAEN